MHTGRQSPTRVIFWGVRVKNFVLGIVSTLVLIALGVYIVSTFGLFPIGADNPPFGLERYLAGRAMNAYVDRNAPEGTNPVAVTPANLADGAKEYEEHCAFCHGGAAAKISPMQRKFSPGAPQLTNRIPRDSEPWLYWVTKHGVRMTGMPAWDGVLSDDDMWKIVAFIKNSDKLPPDVAATWKAMASRKEADEAPALEPVEAAPAPAPAAR